MRSFTFLLIAGLSFTCAAQYPGALDLTYRPNDTGFGNGDGTDRRVQSCVRRPDGRMLVGGAFDYFNGRYQRWMGRLNTDGTRDTSFVPTDLWGSVSPHTINAMVLQPDGMMLIGGNMNRCIQRIQVDGTVDSTFVTGAGFEQLSTREVFALVRQPDGKILVGGRFSTFNGTAVTNLARVNANGTLDATFLTGSGLNDDVLDIALQPDGKMIVAGRFTNCWGSCGHIVRLNANGSLDATFQASPGADNYITDVHLRSDGTVLVAGQFYTVNGTNAPYLCRLTSGGLVDGSFAPPAGLNGIRQLTEQVDQHVLVANGYSMLRLMEDGSLDPTFAPPVLTYQPVYTRVIDAMLQWPDGRIFITGAFTSVNGTAANHFALLHSDGSLDGTYNVPHSFNAQANCMSLLADGSVVVNGFFNGFDGVPLNSWYHTPSINTVVRLTPDGDLDTAGFTPYGETIMRNAQAIQPDGKILTGSFRITRLNPDGSLDATFPNGQLAANNLLWDIEVQPDGKILLSGQIDGFAGVSSPGLVRLNNDGTVDPTLNVGVGFANPAGVQEIALQPDGRIVVSGWFTTYNGISANHICRLMPDGALDTTFHVGAGFNGTTSCVELLPDGRILLAGYGNYNGYPSTGLVLLMPDGSIDSSFVSEPNQNVTNGWPILRYDPIGKILFGINAYNAGLRRLNLDGSIDPTFDTGPEVLDNLTDLVVAPDSMYLITGNFTSYNGVGRNRIARIQGGRSDKTTVQVRAYLGGPYNGSGYMTFSLYNQGLVPQTEPYAGLGYAHTGGGGGETVASWPGYPHLVTDWVVVELRDALDPSIVVATQSALLRRDGQVMSTRFLKNLVFDVPHGTYFVAVHHRNHLGVMSSTSLALDDMPTHVDFTLPATPTYGTAAQKVVGARTVLWEGDASGDGDLKYTGAANDRDAILVAIGGVNPLNTVAGYLREDVNMDGTVKYTGTVNDRDPILVNLPVPIPTSIRLGQVP